MRRGEEDCPECSKLREGGDKTVQEFTFRRAGHNYKCYRLPDECDGCACAKNYCLIGEDVAHSAPTDPLFWLPNWHGVEKVLGPLRKMEGEEHSRMLFRVNALLLALGICSDKRVGNWEAAVNGMFHGPSLGHPMGRMIPLYFRSKGDAITYLQFQYRDTADPRTILQVMQMANIEEVVRQPA